jgi:leucyl aminopeptidase (aminopeptidase T)
LEDFKMSNSEVPMHRSPQWAVNIIHTCMALQHGEKILVVVDEPLSYVRDALLHEAAKASPSELWSFTFPHAMRPFSEYPPPVLMIAAQMDVVILLLASLDLQKEMPAWVAGRASILQGQARFAAGAFIDQSVLDNELSADYHQIAASTQALANWLRGSSTVHITTPLGTDLTLSTAGREWKVDTGILSSKGVYGNLPAGEVYIAPIEESADGILVVDKSLPGLVLSEPVRLVFEKGRVVKIEGGAGAEQLRQAIDSGEKKPNGEGSRVIAELGIGTNPKARLQGNLMTDEKVAGTIHVAIGRNDFLGGKTLAPIHIDGVVSQPTVWVDGKVLIDKGRYLLED